MNFWHFMPEGGAPGTIIQGTYDLWLVLLSFSLAILGSLAALSVIGRLRLLSTTRARVAWLSAGSIAMGSGIWAMHFTGMLAFSLPAEVGFSLWPTLASFVPAVAGSLVALRTLSRPRTSTRSMLYAAGAFAAAIATMHFAGMEAMHVQGAMMFYEPRLFGLSVVVAYLLALLALYVRVVVNDSPNQASGVPRQWIEPIAATVMGAAVAGMHYTAMAAAQFFSGPGAHAGHYTVLPPQSMPATVGALGIAIAVFTMLGVAVDRRLREASQAVMESKLRHHAVVAHMRDGLLVVSGDGQIQSANPAAERIFGYGEKDLVGTPLARIVTDAVDTAEYVDNQCDATGTHRDGSSIALQMTGHATRMGRKVTTTLIVRRLDEVETLERRLRRLAAAVEYTDEAILILDADLHVVYTNPSFQRKFTGTGRSPIGAEAAVALGIAAESPAYHNIKDALARSTVWQGRVATARRDGSERQVDVSISPVRNEINLVTSFVVFLREAAQKTAEKAPTGAAGINAPAIVDAAPGSVPALLKTLGAHRAMLESAPATAKAQIARLLGELRHGLSDHELHRTLEEAETASVLMTGMVRALRHGCSPQASPLEPSSVDRLLHAEPAHRGP